MPLAVPTVQAEVEESVRTTPSASSPSPFHPSPITPSPSPEVDREEEEEMSVPSTPGEERRVSPRRSLLDTVYSENRVRGSWGQGGEEERGERSGWEGERREREERGRRE